MLQGSAPRTPSSLPVSMARTFALRRGRAQWLSVVVGALLLLSLPLVLPPFRLHLLNGCLIAAMGAVALNVLSGNARLVSLGQAAFLGIGAFAAGLLQRAYGVPFPLALCAAAIAGAMAGLLIALLSAPPARALRSRDHARSALCSRYLFSFVQAVFLDRPASFFRCRASASLSRGRRCSGIISCWRMGADRARRAQSPAQLHRPPLDRCRRA
jgi:hypothetical protein